MADLTVKVLKNMAEKKILGKNKIGKVLELLEQTYPDAECALDYGTPYQLLVAVVLSAQTTDKKVNQVTGDLFRLYPTAEKMAQISEEELQERIRIIGMYRQKAKNVIALSRMLIEKYGGEVPDDQDKLMELPGVGRKTANVVMSVAFGHQRIAVDTHVFRVSNRIGIACGNDVLETEHSLMENIPENMWSKSHHMLIWHGRMICSARKPKCGECPLDGICMKNNMDGNSQAAGAGSVNDAGGANGTNVSNKAKRRKLSGGK